MGKAVSWRKIKAEYVAGGISQRELSEKWGVPFGTLQKRARVERWTAKRKVADERAVEKVSQKTADAVADNAVVLERIKGKLLARLETMVDEFPGRNDIAAVYAALEEKTAKGGADIEDLSVLADLLKE